MNTMVKKISYSVVLFAVEKDGGTHKQQTFYDSYCSASNYMEDTRNLREANEYKYYEMGIYKHTEFVCEPTMIRTDIEYLKQYCNGELFKVVSSNKVLDFDLD